MSGVLPSGWDIDAARRRAVETLATYRGRQQRRNELTLARDLSQALALIEQLTPKSTLQRGLMALRYIDELRGEVDKHTPAWSALERALVQTSEAVAELQRYVRGIEDQE